MMALSLKAIRLGASVRNILRCSYSSSTQKLVDVAVNEKTGVATVTLQRLPVNGLNLELLTEMSSTLTELEKNRSRGLILTSASNSVFCAGLDIMEMYKPDRIRAEQFWRTLQKVWIKLYGTSFPSLALINGHSPAGGCLLALSCEYRVMLNNFTIGLNETQLGIVAPPWFIVSMQNVIGSRQTELALTTGRLFSTEEALQVGLIDEKAATKEEALEKAANFFKRFEKISPLARSMTKKSLREKDIQDLVDHRQVDVEDFLSSINNEKIQQGLGLYLEALKKKAK